MSDFAALAILLGACSIALWIGVVRLARTRSDIVSTCFLAGFATLSTLMAFGPVMSTGT